MMHRAWLLILGPLLLAGCGGGPPDTSDLEIGGIYAVRRPGGDVAIMKMLATDTDGTLHLRLYANRFPEVPESIRLDELGMQGATADIGIDHVDMPVQDFRKMKPSLLLSSEVTDDERAPVDQWRQSGAGS